MSVSVEDAATREATYAFVVVELVSIASVNVEDAATRRVMYESVEVAAVVKRLVTKALVVVELVTVVSRKLDEVAVRLLMATLPVKFTVSLKSEKPLKTALVSVGAEREKLVADPLLIVGVSIVVSFR